MSTTYKTVIVSLVVQANGEREHDGTHIKGTEREHQPNIPPPVAIENIEVALQELIRRPRTAELTRGGCVRVRQVASSIRHERIQILSARQTGRGSDSDKLDGRTVDLLATDCLAQETFNEVGVGRETVHPLPPAEFSERLKDTVAG